MFGFGRRRFAFLTLFTPCIVWECEVGTNANQLYEKKLAECGYKSKVQQSTMILFLQKIVSAIEAAPNKMNK
jgi:hypothetical protein